MIFYDFPKKYAKFDPLINPKQMIGNKMKDRMLLDILD